MGRSSGMLLALSLLVIVLVACTPEQECASPYIADGDTCCLDADADGACDATPDAPVQAQGLDCSLCPPQFVTQTEEVLSYRYVCENGSIMVSAAECGRRVVSNAHLFTLSEQGDPVFTTFDARPACRGASQAVELHAVFAQSPLWVTIQARSSPDGPFVDIVTRNGTDGFLDDEYFYLGFCTQAECGPITDGQLSPETAHALRAQAGYASGALLSREVLVDPTPEGEYGQKRCG